MPIDPNILIQLKGYCARAERSPRNVYCFLQKRQISYEDYQIYLERLIADDYCSPERYADDYARLKYRGYSQGPNKIRQALQAQWIPREVIDTTLDRILEEEEPERSLEEILQRKLHSIQASDRRTLYGKLLRFGVGRGYATGEVSQAIRNIFVRLEESDEAEEL